MGNPMPLKYLFEVDYKDKTTFYQNAGDISLTDSTRSAFFDVKPDEVAFFSLRGEGRLYSVDLKTGEFAVNGNWFRMHEEPFKDFRLIFYRRHLHEINREVGEETGHRVIYLLGWQTTHEGKNHQRIMYIE